MLSDFLIYKLKKKMELKPSELRIGNLILNEVCGIVEVISIYKNSYDLSFDGKTKQWFISPCVGIPLTIDWLLKLGFTHRERKGFAFIDVNHSDFMLKCPFVLGGWQEYFCFVYTSTGGICKYVEFKYVHQLQNFFFALTGVELELKK